MEITLDYSVIKALLLPAVVAPVTDEYKRARESVVIAVRRAHELKIGAAAAEMLGLAQEAQTSGRLAVFLHTLVHTLASLSVDMKEPCTACAVWSDVLAKMKANGPLFAPSTPVLPVESSEPPHFEIDLGDIDP